MKQQEHNPFDPVRCLDCAHCCCLENSRWYCRENRKELRYGPHTPTLCMNYAAKDPVN